RRKARLRVAHRCGRVAIYAAEVALPVDQRVAHIPWLSQARKRIIHRGVAVGVHLAEHIADDTGALLVGLIVTHAHIPHAVEDADLDRLEAIARVGQCPRHNHAHGVFQVGGAHLVVDAYRVDDPDLHDASKTRSAAANTPPADSSSCFYAH